MGTFAQDYCIQQDQACHVKTDDQWRRHLAPSGEYEYEPSAQVVAEWLQVLLDPEMNREPEEYYIEKEILRLYRQRVPEYSVAARRWPWAAAQHWLTVGSLVKELFSRRFSFMQWVLEFSRQVFPDICGAEARANDEFLALADALYDGSLSPLHVSAALGLEAMCLHLMEESFAAVTSTNNLAVSPLLCALAGPQVFICGKSMPKGRQDRAGPAYPDLLGGQYLPQALERQDWPELVRLHAHIIDLRARAAVINRLVAFHKEKRILFDVGGYKGRLLMALAFEASVMTGVPAIVRQVLEGGGDAQALRYWIHHDHLIKQSSTRTRDMTDIVIMSIFDQLLAPSRLKLLENVRVSFIETIDKHLISFNLDVEPYSPQRYNEEQETEIVELAGRYLGALEITAVDISDSEFQEALETAFLNESTICFRRLMFHRCFDANAPAPTGGGNGTLLHHAVCDGLYEFVKLLIKAGSDPEARDDQGRTPLMVCNETNMMKKLVAMGATTTSQDKQGRNILHYAVVTKDLPLLGWLADCDACKSETAAARNNKGETPLDLARKKSVYWTKRLGVMDLKSWNAARVAGLMAEYDEPKHDWGTTWETRGLVLGEWPYIRHGAIYQAWDGPFTGII